MRVHHLDCCTMCPVGGRLTVGPYDRLVGHCLLLETERDGLILVDAGLGLADLAEPSRLPWVFRALVRPTLAQEACARRQVERLGYDASDVRHVVLTHLDVDHAGGLADFPEATAHVLRLEYEAAMHPRRAMDRRRYVRAQFATHTRWEHYELEQGERWRNLSFSRPLRQVSAPLVLAPLLGHSAGHAAVIVDDGHRLLLHAGDAFTLQSQLDSPPRCPPFLKAFVTLSAHDRALYARSQRELRELAVSVGPALELFSAHDPSSLRRLAESSQVGHQAGRDRAGAR